MKGKESFGSEGDGIEVLQPRSTALRLISTVGTVSATRQACNKLCTRGTNYPALSDLRKSTAFWQVSGLRPLVFSIQKLSMEQQWNDSDSDSERPINVSKRHFLRSPN